MVVVVRCPATVLGGRPAAFAAFVVFTSFARFTIGFARFVDSRCRDGAELDGPIARRREDARRVFDYLFLRKIRRKAKRDGNNGRVYGLTLFSAANWPVLVVSTPST